jgi:uncharacterized membrane protein (DUF2068 family)
VSIFSPGGFFGVRVIGVYKLVSGVAALALGIWSVSFFDHNAARPIERAFLHLGLDPHNHLIHSAISTVTGLDWRHLRAIEAGTLCYALLHAVEGFGLLRGRDWASYLVVVATSALVPFEIIEIARKMSLLRISILILNLCIVIYLIAALRKEHLAGPNKHPA